MATTPPYPSIPLPSKDIDSMHAALLTMRHTIQLLIVNSQQPTGQPLTEGAQVFNRTTGYADIPQAVLQQKNPLKSP